MLDVVMIVVFITVFAISSLLAYKIMTDVGGNLDLFANNDVSRNATFKGLQAVGSFDTILVFIVIGLTIAVAISAYFIQTHPVYFVASVLMIILFMVLIPVFSNVYEKVESNDAMADAAVEFDITSTFFDNLPTFFFVMCMVVVIALYAKYKGGGGAV